MGIMMLKYIKTYYIGTTDNSIADISKSEIIYINSVGAHGWADTCSKISWAYMNAELRSKFSNDPTHMCIIVSDYVFRKRKTEDEYYSYDRIEFLINNFRIPKNGCVITVYKISTENEGNIFELENSPYIKSKQSREVEWPFQTHNVWPMKKTWDKNSHKDYFSFQKTENKSFTKLTNIDIEEQIENVLNKYGYKIKFVDYTMKPERVYDIILNAKAHISYIGATWHFAHYIGIPVIDYGEHVHQPLSSSIFGVLGAPGIGKDRAQMTINEQNKFVEKKFKGVLSFGLELSQMDPIDLEHYICEKLINYDG